MNYSDQWRSHVESADNIKWGTEAHHKLGDISRDDGDFLYVEREDDDDYIGHWMTGYGFIEVRFPKATTRDITPDERRWLADRPVVFG